MTKKHKEEEIKNSEQQKGNHQPHGKECNHENAGMKNDATPLPETEIKIETDAGQKVESAVSSGENDKDKLNGKIGELTQKLVQNEDKYLRCYADFENYRKRMHKELAAVRINAQTGMILPVINVFNHFRLAVAASETSSDFKALKEGMRLILSEFEKAFNDLGIETIEVKPGQDFDPNFHEAVNRENSGEYADGKIIKQWKPGYIIGGRLLSPAAVVVSCGPAVGEDPEHKTGTEKIKNQSAEN